MNTSLKIKITALVSSVLICAGCATSLTAPLQSETNSKLELDAFPYHPLVYHLDLSILSYQLYAQSLLWPFDPYYEDLDKAPGQRSLFMEKVRAWAKIEGAKNAKSTSSASGLRGPGILGGFKNNANHDPIVYNYDQLYPWRAGLTHISGRWIEYRTPAKITEKIGDVYICYRPYGQSVNSSTVRHIASRQHPAGNSAPNVLLAFEGGTGDKGEKGRSASQSLMGFVLLRYLPNQESFDIHITFRGSRSGKLLRAVRGALSTKSASGNPDWITDLGYFRIGADKGASSITSVGTVHRGFARSMITILPQVFRCLTKASQLAKGKRIRQIFVTGHSLGGGLAQHFTSAVFLGKKYGPDGNGPAMPAALRAWPWKNMKLLTYSAPRAGNENWARTMTIGKLQSEFFSTTLVPIDRKALSVTNPRILTRINNVNRPSGFRVLISSDPVTTEKVAGGKHVGKTVYVNSLGALSSFTMPSGTAHEPAEVRALMVKSLADQRNAATPWRYRKSGELVSKRKNNDRGSNAEYTKLVAAIANYYRRNKQQFDQSALMNHFETFKVIMQSEGRQKTASN